MLDIYELGKEYCSLIDEDEDELDEYDKERLEELKKLNDELDDVLYYYSNGDYDVVSDPEAYAEDWIHSVLGVNLHDHALNYYFDFKKYWEDYLEPDYNEIEWEGDKYWVRVS